MIILITGASHTGKTLLSQRLLETCHYPYLSIDHLKMGLIRSENTELTPEEDDALTEYLWPIVREMVKTAIENHQHLIVEGCYVPFDHQEDWDYLEHVKSIFAPYHTEFYYVELIAPQEIRLQRNKTANRLQHKASKRDIEASDQRLINDDRHYRCVSLEGEIPFDNYLRIDNSDKEPAEVARLIKETFKL